MAQEDVQRKRQSRLHKAQFHARRILETTPPVASSLERSTSHTEDMPWEQPKDEFDASVQEGHPSEERKEQEERGDNGNEQAEEPDTLEDQLAEQRFFSRYQQDRNTQAQQTQEAYDTQEVEKKNESARLGAEKEKVRLKKALIKRAILHGFNGLISSINLATGGLALLVTGITYPFTLGVLTCDYLFDVFWKKRRRNIWEGIFLLILDLLTILAITIVMGAVMCVLTDYITLLNSPTTAIFTIDEMCTGGIIKSFLGL